MGEDNPAYSPTSQTARETASQEIQFQTVSEFKTIGAGQIQPLFSFQNNTSDTRIVEVLTGTVDNGVVDSVQYELEVTNTAGDSFEAIALQSNLPLQFDPGIPWQPNTFLVIEITNISNTAVKAGAAVAIRE